MVKETTDEKNAPEDGGEMVNALEQTGAAMFGEGAELGDGVVFGYDLGRRWYFDGHQGLPHSLIDVVANFRCSVAGHLWPVLINDRLGVGVGLQLELNTLLFGQAIGQAVYISEGAGLEIDIEIGCTEVCPDGVEHEAEDDRVSGANDIELPAN